jgi:predicted phage tail component-like protein
MSTMTFNGVTKPYLTVLRGRNRAAWAPVERTYQYVPNRPGARGRNKRKVNPRPLPVPVMLEGENVSDLQRVKEDMAAWLLTDAPVPLTFSDEPDRIYYAWIDGAFDHEELVEIGQGVIPFVCPDGYKYGRPREVSLSDPYSLTVEGHVDVSPIFTVKFTSPASQYVITDSKTGKKVRVKFNFVAGDVLEIDLTKRKVKINGNINMAAYTYDSRPFKLSPGRNAFSVSPEAAGSLKVGYSPGFH